MEKPVSLLVIEDTDADYFLLEDHLRQRKLNARCHRIRERQELDGALDEGNWDAVLSDFQLAGFDFHETLAFIRQRRPDLPIILVTGILSEKVAVELLGGDIADFVLKHNLVRLVPAIRRAIREAGERRAHEEIQRWATLVFSNIQDGTLVTDRGGTILAINPAFTAITGYTEAEVVGENMRLLQSGHHDAAFYQEMWQAIQTTGGWQGEVWDRRKNGETFLERLTISAVRDQRGETTHYVGTFTDITRLKYAHQMEYLAFHDPLTGLPNRLQLLSRLGHALEITRRHRSQGAVLFLDLDGFKQVNDTWGHAAGDELLQEAARRLLQRLRDMDTLARLGGDEFVIVLEDIDGPESAATVADQVVQILNQPFALADGKEARIGGSVGIAPFPGGGDSPEALLQQADAALYRAKREGRNTYRFHGA